MVKETIKIFARIKPTKPAKTGIYEIDDDDEGYPRLTATVPRELASGFINNKRETYKFRFDRCFDQTTPQDEVFQHVAKPVIDNVLKGYNGTIFAYGQTGSGKTFTITGGAERYVDRGIIPRSLSYIFSKTENNPDLAYTVHISYLEIYNENGYDLLDPKHEAAKLEDLPKVSLMEDSDQNIHLKNLTVHQAATEEEALNLLFLGDTNRMIAETPMNQASSRSHCIFTVHITAREAGSATIKRAKLHLVDLAGSERVSKTGVNGVLLQEAKYINLSLHFLESVIIALSDKNRQHVPYRNSMMTSVLRDSLGGNCMTTMIATCSMEKRNMDESISTCRFAQRVAMIRNDVMLNEELDPRLLIQKLKRENQELKEQLGMATGEQLSDELTIDELQWCEDAVKRYLDDTDADSYLSVGHDLRKIQLCFRILKRYVLERPAVSQQPSAPPRPESPPDVGPYSKAENKRLKDLLLQRDNEINILVNMLKREKKRAADAESMTGSTAARTYRRSSESNGHAGSRSDQEADRREMARPNSETLAAQSGQRATGVTDKDERMKTKILGPMSLGRQEAFDIFLRDYHHSQAIEENKQVLKQRYGQAKALGERLNTAKQRINHLKSELEELRLQGGFSEQDMEEMEHGLREEMETAKHSYKETFVQLRNMKTEIEHLQHLLEKSKVKMMKDFEMWWTQQTQANQPQASVQQGGVRSAWNTPPITPQLNGGNLSQRNYAQEVVSRNSEGDAPSMRPVGSGRHSRGMAANFGGTQQTGREATYTMNQSRAGAAGGGGGGDIPLTGDPQADADIMAFVRARQNILQQAQGNR